MAPFNGMFFFNDYVEPMARMATGQSNWSNAGLPVFEAGKDMVTLFQFMGQLAENPGGALEEKGVDAAKAGANIIGDFFYGLPAKEVVSLLENAFEQLEQEQFLGMVGAIMGYGKSTLPEAA